MAKYAAKGAILKQDDGTSTFVAIANVGDVSFQHPQRERIDVTTHDSSGGFREYVDGVLGEGTLSFPLVYDPANATHERLRASQVSGGNKNFQLILPDAGAAQFAFAALVTKFDINAGVNGRLEAQVELKTSGAITFTA